MYNRDKDQDSYIFIYFTFFFKRQIIIFEFKMINVQ